jgi:segregation and condensation protein B
VDAEDDSGMLRTKSMAEPHLALHQARTTEEAHGLSEAELVAHLTALLFVADEPLDISSLARVLDVRPATLEKAVQQLVDRPPPGLILQRQDRRVQLATAPSSAEYVRRMRGRSEAQRLSRAAMEVLSVVAYRQPATRAEIEQIRGVNSDHALETLLARGLVVELGRRESIGRPMLFGTTLEFLQLAGLKSLDELPPLGTESDDRRPTTDDRTTRQRAGSGVC